MHQFKTGFFLLFDDFEVFRWEIIERFYSCVVIFTKIRFFNLLFSKKRSKKPPLGNRAKNSEAKPKSFKLLLLASEDYWRNFIVFVINHSKAVVLY